ncbi:MAG: serine--tRNA ligase [Spirochaetales bacterium]|nr:serine--tRNA ligase [Spirochaetales bacterium]
MLDIKFIRENLEAVRENITQRFMTADPDKAVELYDRRNELIKKAEELRQKRNENAARMKQKLDNDTRQEHIEEGKELKTAIAAIEEDLQKIDGSLQECLAAIPNMAHKDAPKGKEEKDNTEIKRFGKVREFSFTPKDHVELGKILDILDFDTGAKVSGPKFYFLKNEGVFLEMALCRYAMDILQKKGFICTITPDIAKEEIVEGTGFNPRGTETNIYTLEGLDACLVGTAEITLGGYYADSVIPADQLPIKMAGMSHCFRREAGAAGQYSKGFYRVHQFTKVEMFVYCHPGESEKMHEELLEIEEQIFTGLDIPFRVVDTCTGDLGAPAYRKYDLEAWMPGRGEDGGWGEITSTSNCTDYQARRLKVRFKDSDGNNRYVHMLNGTALAVSRAFIAIVENFQNEDGSVSIPAKLQVYTGFAKIEVK